MSSLFLVGCGSDSIESDAKRLAEIQCKAQKLVEQAASGDMSVLEESTQLAAESEALTNELESKYTSDADQEKFARALLKEIGNCN